MLKDAVNFIETLSPSLAVASSLMVFFGGGYIAMHSRVMPRWAVTCLWYLGLAALLNFITFVVEWTQGQLHPLSHFQIGLVTETLIHVVLAITVGLLFFHTVWKDYLGSRQRQELALNPLVKKNPVPRKRTTSRSTPVKKVTGKKVLRKTPYIKKASTETLKSEQRLEF